jgi:NADPH-dependent 2,4-dienoyl-CoA reductase/sulfur reductase-like enzyme
VQLGERLSGGDAERAPGELVLWAVGTRPNSAWLATDHPRLLTAQGTVRVDRFLGWPDKEEVPGLESWIAHQPGR